MAKIHLIDDTRHGLPWKEIFQGVVTLCVGLFAGWIAWQQKEIAKENKEITKQKLKLEIFLQKRIDIIQLYKLMWESLRENEFKDLSDW
ncbi:hypothetical protein [Acetobacter sp. DmW_043]|uniref:hypothetical protein n=1 Tax=Acetobacter sp. DmW_043 TaxID=1670658 RepID=UPI001177F475|nr:hypothetical protein [Acetobacter sp. DmW_043]